MRDKQGGFTLMEILVVLVISGVVSTILLQSLSQVYRLQERFGLQLAQSQLGAMQSDWFRQWVQGLQVEPIGSKDALRGSVLEFSGITTEALSVGYGSPKRFVIKLSLDERSKVMRLTYTLGTNDTQMLMMAMPGVSTCKFSYLDRQGQLHEQWPPASGIWPQLPSAVLLHWHDEEERVWVGVPRGSTEPPPATLMQLQQ